MHGLKQTQNSHGLPKRPGMFNRNQGLMPEPILKCRNWLEEIGSQYDAINKVLSQEEEEIGPDFQLGNSVNYL